MIKGDLVKFKDRCLTNAAEILLRVEGDGPFTSDDWNLLEAELRMHKALVMELHFMRPSDTSSKRNDLFLSIEHLAEHIDQHPEDGAIVKGVLTVLRKLEAFHNGGAL